MLLLCTLVWVEQADWTPSQRQESAAHPRKPHSHVRPNCRSWPGDMSPEHTPCLPQETILSLETKPRCCCLGTWAGKTKDVIVSWFYKPALQEADFSSPGTRRRQEVLQKQPQLCPKAAPYWNGRFQNPVCSMVPIVSRQCS